MKSYTYAGTPSAVALRSSSALSSPGKYGAAWDSHSVNTALGKTLSGGRCSGTAGYGATGCTATGRPGRQAGVWGACASGAGSWPAGQAPYAPTRKSTRLV